MCGVFIDGDFSTGKKCKQHCSPTCHPGQVDENHWHYGCLLEWSKERNMEELLKEILDKWIDDYSIDGNINTEWLSKHIAEELNKKGVNNEKQDV